MKNSTKSMLSVTITDGDGIDIGDDVRIRCEVYSQHQTRIVIEAPKTVEIHRFKTPDGEDAFDRDKALRVKRATRNKV